MGSAPIRDLQAMLRGMDPVLDEATAYRFIQVAPDIAPQALGAAIATIREAEGVTAVIPSTLADELGQGGPDFARITLQVHSDLEGAGLTAAVATALASEQIACNVIAAFHHDHLFVPWDKRAAALAALKTLSQDAHLKA
ncbi:MAG: ACT domain-containing protein [Marinomonas sp.]